MDPLKHAIDCVGGPQKAAEICGFSTRYVYRLLSRGALPRTEYTGETDYAERLAASSGGAFTAEWLRDNARPAAA